MWSTCNCKSPFLEAIVFCVLSWTVQKKSWTCARMFLQRPCQLYSQYVCVCAHVDEVLFCRCLTTVTLCAAWMRVPAVRSHCWCGHCAVKPRPKDFPLCPRCTGEKKKKTLNGKNKKTHSKVVGSSCVSLQRELPFPWIDGAKEESRSSRTTSGLTLWRVGLFFLGLLYT